MSSSKKHDAFVNESIRNKKVSDVPGIGKVAERHFRQNGITEVISWNRYYFMQILNCALNWQAKSLQGVYLEHDKNKEAVENKFKDLGKLNNGNASKCFRGIEENYNNFN